MKSAVIIFPKGRLGLALGLLLLLTSLPTCPAVEKLGLAPYNAFLAKASSADRLQITTILTDVANTYGLKKGPLAADTLAFFYAPPSGLGLAMRAGSDAVGGEIHINVGPVALGIKPNAQRTAVIAAVDAGLRRAFGDRLKKEIPAVTAGKAGPPAAE